MGEAHGPAARTSDRFVLHKARERGVTTVELWAVDPLGQVQVVTVPLDALDAALDEGFAVASEALGELFERTDAELVLAPDPATFTVLGRDTARLLCDLRTLDGAPSSLCARSALKRVIGRAGQLGSMFYVGATVQHRWTRGPEDERTIDDPRALRALGQDAARALEGHGIAWRSFYFGSDGRFCLELDWVDPLTLADAIVTHRRVAHDLAAGADALHASFAPFPTPGPRSRLDLYLSLTRDGAVAFDDAFEPGGVAPAARAFIEQLGAELGGLELIMRHTLGSYPAPEAAFIGRGPAARGEGATVAVRGADASANPYTLLAAVIGLGAEPRESLASTPVPPARSLLEAAHRASGSTRLRDLLGAELVAKVGAAATR